MSKVFCFQSLTLISLVLGGVSLLADRFYTNDVNSIGFIRGRDVIPGDDSIPVPGCKKPCYDYGNSFYECDHTSMDPAVACNEDQCLTNYFFWCECVDGFPANESEKCRVIWDPDEVRVTQTLRVKLGLDCGDPNVSDAPNVPGGPCVLIGAHTGRCFIPACSGPLHPTITIHDRIGRLVCASPPGGVD